MAARLVRAALVATAAIAVSYAYAQSPSENSASTLPTPSTAAAPVAPPATPSVVEVPANAVQPQVIAPSNEAVNVAAPPAPRRAPPVAAGPPAPPPGPPPPVRSPTAVLRVLDKVTAETLRFEAPVGRPMRYKTLIFLVKACETRGLKDPMPRPSAFLVIDSAPRALPGRTPPPPKEVFRGWIFATAPGLHLFEHPVYDAWLESCTSDIPPV